jgi:tRNA A-37 threonylcarbamoyl transferase component Bud32
MTAAHNLLPAAMSRIESFSLSPGRVLARKYEVIRELGRGYEGQVYLVREQATGIERAAKLFFPERNLRNRVAIAYAKKLHKLRYCEALIQYLNQEIIRFEKQDITLLISEFVEGEVMADYLQRQRGQRLPEFEALHLIHAIAAAVAPMHRAREYHGDLHSENIILRRTGLGFDIKLLDFYISNGGTRQNVRDDVCDIVRLLYDVLGGPKRYTAVRPEIKDIIKGLKRTLIAQKFRSADHLRVHLETMSWDQR